MLLLTAFNWLKKSDVRFVTLEEETFGFENKDTPAIFLYKSFGGMIIKDSKEKGGEGLALFRAV